MLEIVAKEIVSEGPPPFESWVPVTTTSVMAYEIPEGDEARIRDDQGVLGDTFTGPCFLIKTGPETVTSMDSATFLAQYQRETP